MATLDPDLRNNGAGVAILQASGVEVVVGVCEHEALRDLEPYLALSANSGFTPAGFPAGDPSSSGLLVSERE